MQNESAKKTPAYGGYGGVRRSGYHAANTIENSLPPNIILHCVNSLALSKLNASPMPTWSVAVDYGASLRSVARFKIVAVAEPGDEGISIGLDKPSGLLS